MSVDEERVGARVDGYAARVRLKECGADDARALMSPIERCPSSKGYPSNKGYLPDAEYASIECSTRITANEREGVIIEEGCDYRDGHDTGSRFHDEAEGGRRGDEGCKVMGGDDEEEEDEGDEGDGGERNKDDDRPPSATARQRNPSRM